MKPLFIGDADDALGFAIAGFASEFCGTREAVASAIASASKDDILVLSASAAALVPEQIEEWKRAPAGPMFVILPPRKPASERRSPGGGR